MVIDNIIWKTISSTYYHNQRSISYNPTKFQTITTPPFHHTFYTMSRISRHLIVSPNLHRAHEKPRRRSIRSRRPHTPRVIPGLKPKGEPRSRRRNQFAERESRERIRLRSARVWCIICDCTRDSHTRARYILRHQGALTLVIARVCAGSFRLCVYRRGKCVY